nr:EG45-like domain containing protein [Ipomoea trifida]
MGLSAAQLERLPRIRGDGLAVGNDCAVCLDGIERDQVARMIPGCKHVFHLRCADTWLAMHSACPLCRNEGLPWKIENGDSVVEAMGKFSFGKGGDIENYCEMIVEENPCNTLFMRKYAQLLQEQFSHESRPPTISGHQRCPPPARHRYASPSPTTSATACFGTDRSQFPSSNYFAAAGEGIWDNGASCGRQYLVSCISSVLPKACKKDQTIQIRIVDRAQTSVSRPTKPGTTMVLSNAAFAAIADPSATSLNIEFQQ